MIEQLKILEGAMADAGVWLWWTESDNVFQAEFTWVKLFVKSPEADEPPTHTVALQFENPVCVIALDRKLDEASLPEDWMDKLAADEIDGFPLSGKDFTLTDSSVLMGMAEGAEGLDFLEGTEEDLEKIDPAHSIMGFWAGATGLIVIAESMKVLAHEGELAIGDVKSRHEEWLRYWNGYWDKRGTDGALPEDGLCEVTLPEGNGG